LFIKLTYFVQQTSLVCSAIQPVLLVKSYAPALCSYAKALKSKAPGKRKIVKN